MMASRAKMPGTWMSDFSDELNAMKDSLACTDLGSSTIELENSQPPTPDGTGLPINFHIIGPGLYRCSYPDPSHFPELEKYQFKTFITLVSQEIPEATKAFVKMHGISHQQIHVVANKDPNTFADAETIGSIIKIMMNRENHPVLIHCNKGKHRTGCVSAIFRKCTGWTNDACIAEYVQYSEEKARDLDKAFISSFDVSELKPLALEGGFVGGSFAPPYESGLSTMSNNSAFTNQTFVSSASTSIEGT